jgi:hypothetical protein
MTGQKIQSEIFQLDSFNERLLAAPKPNLPRDPRYPGTAKSSTMISRSALRGTRLALERQTCTAQRRAFAAAATTPSDLAYESSTAAGIKIASRDAHGPTTKLAVVARGGTRYEPRPGLTIGLEEFAFKVGWETAQHQLQTAYGT